MSWIRKRKGTPLGSHTQKGYAGAVAEEITLEKGQLLVGVDHFTMGKIEAPNALGLILVSDPSSATGFVWTSLADELGKMLPNPPETPKPGNTIVAGDDLKPHWAGSTPPPPPPPTDDTKWRDIYDPSDKYVARKNELNPLEFEYTGLIRIRRVKDKVTLKVRSLTGKTTSANPSLISYVLPLLPGDGWLPAASASGNVDSSVGTVKWEINPNGYETGPGLHIPNKIAVYSNLEFAWTSNDSFPSALPRESADQT